MSNLRFLLNLIVTEGVSQAGKQAGLGDARSSLVSEAFTTFDRMPRGWGAHSGFGRVG